jgi:hypothetical protein
MNVKDDDRVSAIALVVEGEADTNAAVAQAAEALEAGAPVDVVGDPAGDATADGGPSADGAEDGEE